MEALPEGLHAKCDVTDSLVAWSGIHDVIETADYVFVMLEPTRGYVVPRNRITGGDLNQFLAAVTQYIPHARVR